MPAPNERFHASGGATRPTLCVGQLLAALVRALSMPPPAAKLPPRYLSFWDSEARFGSEKKEKRNGKLIRKKL